MKLLIAITSIAIMAGATFAEQPDVFVPYVQSNGDTAQYLDTGVKGRYGTKAEMSLEWLDLGNANDIDDDIAFLCARKNNSRVYFCHNNASVILAGYGQHEALQRDGQYCKWETNRIYSVVTEFSATNSEGKVTATMSVDGEQLWNETLNMVDTGIDLYLFAMNYETNGVGTISNPGAARCYGVKIWQDGELVRDYRPCVKDARGALYDDVSQTVCYSSGSSDFLYDAAFKEPSKYVEYVETDGTVFVDTGVTGKSGTAAELDVIFLKVEDRGCLGSRNENTRFLLLHNGGSIYGIGYAYGYGSGSYYNMGEMATGVLYHVESSLFTGSQVVKVNGTTMANASVTTEYDTGLSMYLFACNKDGAVSIPGSYRFYGAKIWQGNADGSDMRLVRNLRPVRLKDGSVTLWDFQNSVPYRPQSVSEPYVYTKFSAVGPERAAIRAGICVVFY